MLFRLLLAFLILNAGRAFAINPCDKELILSSAKQDLQPETAMPIIARLPEEIKPLMKEALLKTMGLGLGSDWSQRVIREMKVSGLFSAEEFRREIETRLQFTLDQGRKVGLSTVDLPKLLAEAAPSKLPKDDIISNKARFTTKYDLNKLAPLVDAMRQFENQRGELSRYSINLPDALFAARELQSDILEKEVLQHMLLLRDYEQATFAAEEVSADAALINISLFALADYFRPGSPYYLRGNNVYSAIAALKRVQDPQLKSRADQILFDLAQEYLSADLHREVLANEGKVVTDESLKAQRASHMDYAFTALRSTGELLVKLPEDSVKVNFVTQVTDPKVVQYIRLLLKELIAENNMALIYGEAQQAALAIGDTEDIEKASMNLLSKALAEKDTFRIGMTLENFAKIKNRQHFKRTLVLYLDGLIEDGQQYYPQFNQLIYSIRKDGLEYALPWIKEDLAGELSDPKYDYFRNKLDLFLKYGATDIDPNNIQDHRKYIPAKESVSDEIYRQMVTEAVYIWSNIERVALTKSREEFIADAINRIKNNDALNARTILLYAAVAKPKNRKGSSPVQLQLTAPK